MFKSELYLEGGKLTKCLSASWTLIDIGNFLLIERSGAVFLRSGPPRTN